ncbi:hypothetical protein [Photobacterium iliopiscarium]|jgi:hypothetical protein|uniref:hypothetical protein n=1 Tax=Photobacterium iliopiscarium TaxID=56192 RepID=UPI000AB57509|nr:hypothetical protein [Photobacterium iliopiscarium]
MIILLVLFILSSLALFVALRLCRFNDSPNDQFNTSSSPQEQAATQEPEKKQTSKQILL